MPELIPQYFDVVYHLPDIITNATYTAVTIATLYRRSSKTFKHVTIIENRDHIALWKALDANIVESGARYIQNCMLSIQQTPIFKTDGIKSLYVSLQSQFTCFCKSNINQTLPTAVV